MSVDANVLIFERIREELNRGKGLKQSVRDGFNNALSSILDANITTGLTALILFVFGSGPIKGFHTTLLIGIATSLFTAIFITRMLVDSRLSKSKILNFSTPLTKFIYKYVNYLLTKKDCIFLSRLLTLSIFSLSTNGLNQGVDFVGGRTYTVRFDNDVNQTEIQASLVEVLGNAEAKTFGSDNQLKITTNYKVDVEGTQVDDEIQSKMFEALSSVLPSTLTYDDFVNGSDDKSVGIMGSSKVGPTITI